MIAAGANVTTGLANGDILKWDSTAEVWVNSAAPPASISGSGIGDLGDVTLEASNLIQDKEVLVWDSTSQDWINYGLKIEDLEDVILTSVVEGAVPQYNSSLSTYEVKLLDYSFIANRPTAYSDLINDTLTTLESIPDVVISGIAQGDIITYNATLGQWENAAAPPVSLTANSLDDLGDVNIVFIGGNPAGSTNDNRVLAWDTGAQEWQLKRLNAADVEGAADKVSDLTKDVSISYWTNDVGYLTNINNEYIYELADVSVSSVQEGQMLVRRNGLWKNEFGPPANITTNTIGDLSDVTRYQQYNYTQAELTFEDIGRIKFDDINQASNIRYDLLYDNDDQSLGLEAIRGSDETGSSISVSRGYGVSLRSDINVIRLRGNPDVTTNRPELRFETGDYSAQPPTGKAISIKMPSTVLEDVVYVLPQEDGDVGDVLATDGSGELSWVARVQNSNLNGLSDVDLQTQLPVDGSTLVYNALASQWVPGSSIPDLSTSSVNALSDVDTSTVAPTTGQALIWNSTNGEWVPGDVATDLSSESIDTLSDVDTSTITPTAGQGLVWDGSQWAPGDVSDVDLATSSVDDLSDVDTTTVAPTTGQGLVWDGSQWAPGDVSDVDLAASSIDELSDVNTTTSAPSDGQALVWNAANNEWRPGLSTIGSLAGFETRDLDDVSSAAPQSGEALIWTGSTYNPTELTIDTLSDVDTSSSAPAIGQGLVWNGAKWAPADTSLSGKSIDELQDVDTATLAPSIGQSLVWDGTNWIPYTVTGGGGGTTGSAISQSASEAQTSDASGLITFTGLGTSGTLVSIESDADAWVTIYATAGSRVADASRSFSDDPAAGSGILADFYLTANTEVMTSPSTNYFNAML